MGAGKSSMKDITVTIIENASDGRSHFSEEVYSLEDFNGMFISQQQEAINFRHRQSRPGYFSSWHVAGDPTLIVIRQGTLRLTLRNGEYRDFTTGDQFIARDHLGAGIAFDDSIHGHTAEVIGTEVLQALHLKLDRR